MTSDKLKQCMLATVVSGLVLLNPSITLADSKGGMMDQDNRQGGYAEDWDNRPYRYGGPMMDNGYGMMNGPMYGGYNMMRGPMGMMGGPMYGDYGNGARNSYGMSYSMRGLNLNEKQQKQIRDMQKEQRKLQFRNMEKAMNINDELANLYGETPLNVDKIMEKHEQLHAQHREMLRNRLEFENKVMDMLTLEQREQLQNRPMPGPGPHMMNRR